MGCLDTRELYIGSGREKVRLYEYIRYMICFNDDDLL